MESHETLRIGDEMDVLEFLATMSAVEQALGEAEKGEGLSLEEFDQMMRAKHGIQRQSPCPYAPTST